MNHRDRELYALIAAGMLGALVGAVMMALWLQIAGVC